MVKYGVARVVYPFCQRLHFNGIFSIMQPHITKSVRAIILITLVTVFWELNPPMPRAAQNSACEITHYEATFEPLKTHDENTYRNVAVTLYIDYHITEGTKSGGFKYVGTKPVRDIQVTDEKQRPLPFIHTTDAEHKISWMFNPVSEGGRQTVVASFIIVDALEGDTDRNQLAAPWVKNWQVPVRDITYSLILPPGKAIDRVSAGKLDGRFVDYTDCRAYEIHMDTLSDTPLTFSFSPGLVNTANTWLDTIDTGIRYAAYGIGIFALIKLFMWVGSGGHRNGGGIGGCSGCSGCGGGGGCGGGCGG